MQGERASTLRLPLLRATATAIARNGGMRHVGARRVVMVGLSLIMLLGTAQRVSAIIVFLKKPGPPIRGYLVRQTEQAVILRALRADGTTEQRTIPRTEIDQVIVSVAADRLAALDPKKPDGYREYAEELAEKRKDPDARQTAIRLFIIAAYLAPDRLGRSSMLGLIPLARSEQEQRRFRAMAYLLDPTHDPALLKLSLPSPPPSSTLDRGRARAMVRALQLLRQGRRRQALSQAKHLDLKKNLGKLTTTITYHEFEQACANVCPHCTHGYIPCPECKGKKTVPGSTSIPVTCPVCGGSGRVVCPYCHGNYRNNPLSPSLLRRIVLIELAWLPAGADTPKMLAEALKKPTVSWGHAVARGQIAPIMPLRLDTLTEMNPAACRYRDGKWVTP